MTRGQKSRARREPSGAFQLFQAPQIQQFKEAFSLIDQDGDGIVSEKDLKAVFSNLGKPHSFLRLKSFYDDCLRAIHRIDTYTHDAG